MLFDVQWEKLAASLQEDRQQGAGLEARPWALAFLTNPASALAKNLWWKRVHNRYVHCNARCMP